MRKIWVGALVVASAGAQGVAPTCPTGDTCRIVIERALVLDSVDRAELSAPPSAGARNAAGTVVLTFWDGLPVAYGPDGRFIGRVGRKGQGPGEFSNPAQIRVAADGNFVIADTRNNRLTLVDVALRPGKSRPFVQSPIDFLPLEAGSIVVGQPQRTGAAFSVPLLQLDSLARVVKTLTTVSDMTYLAPASRGGPPGFWTRSSSSFAVSSCALDGVCRALAVRKPSGFQEMHPGKPGPPTSRIVALYESDGVLWIATIVPRAGWEAGMPGASGREGSVSAIQWDKLVDTMIQAVDPTTGRVLAEQRLDRYAPIIVDPGLLVSWRVMSTDHPLIELWKFRLTK